MFSTSAIKGISLEASGLIALADLHSIANRTALTGSSSLLDIFFLAPGIHCQQAADEVNRGEYPTTGAMTSGYVFRIENQATVGYLQRVGRPGHLVNVAVSSLRPSPPRYSLFLIGILASTLYLSGIALTITIVALLVTIHDWWGLGVLGMLMLARLLNVVVIKRRVRIGWKGVSEPGVHGDLLVLLSQDRWVRLQGLVDDLKAVTAGQWLRDKTPVESFCAAAATLLVYTSAALASNASKVGSLLIACLLLISAALLGLSNSVVRRLQMFGRTVYVEGEPKAYTRRLDLAHELIEVSQRDDWAIAMGLIVPPTSAAQHVIL